MYSDYSETAGLPALRPVPAPPPPTGTGTLMTIILRLEETIAAETVAIRSDPKFDLKSSNARKSRSLYELNRAVKAEGGVRPEHRPAILRLQESLTVNERAIRAHLSAVNEVAALIHDAIHVAEADGTYSSAAFGRV